MSQEDDEKYPARLKPVIPDYDLSIFWAGSCTAIINWRLYLILGEGQECSNHSEMIFTHFTNDQYLSSPQSSQLYCPSGIVKLYHQECT